MAYQVLARKWRPQTFAEVVGEHTAAQRRALLDKLWTLQVVEIERIGLKLDGIGRCALHFHPDIREQTDEIIDIKDVGNIANRDGFCGEQRGADDFQRLVFGSLGLDGAAQWAATFDDKRLHGALSSFLFIVGMGGHQFSFVDSLKDKRVHEWDAKLANKASNLGAAENATGLPTATWKMKNFTVENYTELFNKVKSGEITIKSEVPKDCNDEAWIKKDLEKTTIIFEK